MTKKILFSIAFIIVCISLFQTSDHHSYSFTSGSPGGYTNSLGDGTKTCRTCHGPGAAAPLINNIITTDIPASGYLSGVTYNITITFSEVGRSKFGFEATSENAANQKKGTFINSTTQTRTLGTTAPRITHTNSGTSAVGGNKTWTFQWKAPLTGSGAITFYASLNATNSNNNDDSGDNVYTTKLVVNEDPTSGLAEYISSLNSKISIFPNPVGDILHLDIPVEFGEAKSIEIMDLQGKKLLTYSENLKEINVSGLSCGSYLMLVIGSNTAVKRFVKQ